MGFEQDSLVPELAPGAAFFALLVLIQAALEAA
jgi:hypothetical protein